jgi:hypothetical protein
VWDYDLVSANDEIGRVQIDLNGLLLADSAGQIAGWFPIFDTLRGICGTLHVAVKMQFLSNWNQFRDDSAGLLIFASTAPLACYRVTRIFGFVDELVMGDDPEYHWTDSFRASRISNEERQNLLYALSGRLRRQIGLKVLGLGGNAVVAYRQEMTFEGVKGNIVVRGYGTACYLRRPGGLPAFTLDPSSSAAGTPDRNSPEGTPRDSPRVRASPAASSSLASVALAAAAAAQQLAATTADDAAAPRGTATRSAVSLVNALLRETTFGEHPNAHPTPLSRATATTSVREFLDAADDSARRQDALVASRSLRQSVPVDANPPPIVRPSLLAASDSGLAMTQAIEIGANEAISVRASGALGNSFDMSSTGGGGGGGGGSVAGGGNGAESREDDGAPQAVDVSDSDVELITLDAFPDGVGVVLGGALSARSVKIYTSATTREQRDHWWTELRDEIKMQARALGCAFVIGYRETTAIQANEELVLLAALGTAAHIYARPAVAALATSTLAADPGIGSFGSASGEFSTQQLAADGSVGGGGPSSVGSASSASALRPLPSLSTGVPPFDCRIFHVPYAADTAPTAFRVTPCAMCGAGMVPSVLLSTIEPPPNLPSVGVGTLIEARMCRAKKDAKDDVNAMIVSDALPFLEYDLHRQLLYKLRIAGMNAAFSLTITLTVGNSLIIGIASCTAVHIAALPVPAVLHIERHIGVHDAEDANLLRMQQQIEQLSQKNCRRIARQRARLLRAARAASSRPRRSRRVRAGSSSSSSSSSSSEDDSADTSSSSSTTTSSGAATTSTTSSLAPMLDFVPSTRVRRAPAERSTSSDSSSTTSRNLNDSESSEARAAASSQVGSAMTRTTSALSIKSAESDDGGDATDENGSSSLPKVAKKAASIARKTTTIVAPPSSILSSSEDSSSTSDVDGDDERPPSRRRSGKASSTGSKTPRKLQARADSESSGAESDDSGGRRRLRRRRVRIEKVSSRSPETSSPPLPPAVTMSAQRSGRKRQPAEAGSSPAEASTAAAPLPAALELDSDHRGDEVLGGDSAFAVQIDDEIDEDTLAVLLDAPLPPGFALSRADTLPGADLVGHLQQAVVMRRVRWTDVPPHRLNNQLVSLIRDVYEALFFRLRHLKPCVIVHVETRVQLYESNTVEVIFAGVAARSALHVVSPADFETAFARAHASRSAARRSKKKAAPATPAAAVAAAAVLRTPGRKERKSVAENSRDDAIFPLDDVGGGDPDDAQQHKKRTRRRKRGGKQRSSASRPAAPAPFPSVPMAAVPALPFVQPELQSLRMIEMTSMSFVPGAVAVRSLGRLNIHLIKESTSLREDGGLGAFNSTVLVELNAVARAHVRAMGGNALLGYHLDVCFIHESSSHEKAYALFSLSGDVFLIRRTH